MGDWQTQNDTIFTIPSIRSNTIVLEVTQQPTAAVRRIRNQHFD